MSGSCFSGLLRAGRGFREIDLDKEDKDDDDVDDDDNENLDEFAPEVGRLGDSRCLMTFTGGGIVLPPIFTLTFRPISVPLVLIILVLKNRLAVLISSLSYYFLNLNPLKKIKLSVSNFILKLRIF